MKGSDNADTEKMKKFDFKTDLETKGLSGEKDFQTHFPMMLIKSPILKYDFITSQGETIEVKTDYYESKNFFFERWSDKDNQKPGGPWQSDMHHTQFFIYWFIKNRKFYVFEVSELVNFLNAYLEEKKPRMIDVPNNGYTTQGFLIPIAELESVACEINDEAMNEDKNTMVEKSSYLRDGYRK